MSARDGAHSPITAGESSPSHPPADPLDAAGTYLTDEVFLYRVVGGAWTGTAETVELEDCYLLDVVRVSLSDLRARRLKIVTPAPIEA
jgi:hypothetical protein